MKVHMQTHHKNIYVYTTHEEEEEAEEKVVVVVVVVAAGGDGCGDDSRSRKVRGSEMLEFWFTEGGRYHEPGEMSFGGREMQKSRLNTRTPWSIPTLPTS